MVIKRSPWTMGKKTKVEQDFGKWNIFNKGDTINQSDCVILFDLD